LEMLPMLPALNRIMSRLSNLRDNVKKMLKKRHKLIIAFLVNRLVFVDYSIALFSNCCFYGRIRRRFIDLRSQ
ncbi:MAG: hypothetical protein LV471_10845, partial [Nitrosomonas sp.]|nr:hypothetical protein [Nitrosomonas sp.]